MNPRNQEELSLDYRENQEQPFQYQNQLQEEHSDPHLEVHIPSFQDRIDFYQQQVRPSEIIQNDQILPISQPHQVQRSQIYTFLQLLGKCICDNVYKLLLMTFLFTIILFFQKYFTLKSFFLILLLLLSSVLVIICCLRFYLKSRRTRTNTIINGPPNQQYHDDIHQSQPVNVQRRLSSNHRARRFQTLMRNQTQNLDRMIQITQDHQQQNLQRLQVINHLTQLFNNHTLRVNNGRIGHNQFIVMLQEAFQAGNHQDHNNMQGLTQEEIENLPIHIFSESEKLEKQTTEEQKSCIVCLVEFELAEEIRTLPICLHQFHKDCIDKWLLKNKSCPICRQSSKL